MTPMPLAAPLARALLRSQSDERLMALARDEKKGAFDEIVRRYRAPLVAFAAAYAPGGKAEDVVQESLTNAWVSLRGSQREIALRPWLYAIVRNRALNARRDARYHEPLDESIEGVRRPEDIVLEREELSRAVAAVAALPDAQRKALVDSALCGRTHAQIAAEMRTSPGSVRGMIHRGRSAVRAAAGSIVPLPVVAWAEGTTGGALTGGAAAGSVVGGSLAAKGATVAAIAVLATGSGVAIERSFDDSANADREASAGEGPSADDSARSGGSGNDKAGARDDGASDGSGGGGPGKEPGEGERDEDDSRRDDDHEDDDSGSGSGGANSGNGGGDDGPEPGGGGDSGSGGDDDNPEPGDDDDDDDFGSGSEDDDVSLSPDDNGGGGEDDSDSQESVADDEEDDD